MVHPDLGSSLCRSKDPSPKVAVAVEEGTHRRFGDGGSSRGPSITPRAHSICLCMFNLKGSGEREEMPLSSATIMPHCPLNTPWPCMPPPQNTCVFIPRSTPCSCGH